MALTVPLVLPRGRFSMTPLVLVRHGILSLSSLDAKLTLDANNDGCHDWGVLRPPHPHVLPSR
eukprot:scaffold22469_cov92-Cyclotella_meneghiniana.AAC.3